jgi:hypothetical protein
MLKYTDITQNTYVKSWTVTQIMAREIWNFDSCYTLIDYKIRIKTDRNMWFLLISVLNIKLTYEWHKALKLNYKNSRTTVVFVLRSPSTLRRPQLCLYLVTSEVRCCKSLAKVTALLCLAAWHAQWTSIASLRAYSTWTPQKPTLLMAIISVTVQLLT